MPIRRRLPRYKKKQMRRRGAGRRRLGGLRRSKYHGIKFMKETILKETLTMPSQPQPGGFPAGLLVRKFTCNLSQISPKAAYLTVSPNTAIPALFGRYCITGVKWTFIPLNTQTDSGTRPADRVCYAINRDPQDLLTGEDDIIRQDDCKFTNSTRKFSVFVKHPKPILASTANQMAPRGMDYTGYAAPNIGPPYGTANQVAFTTGDNKWIWLPTRTGRLTAGTDASGNEVKFDPGYTSDQLPDHVGLDFVATANAVPTADYNMYNVYQTLYLALKEQD